MKKENEVFAEGLCGKKLFIIYVLGSLFGCYYEQILNFCRHLRRDGSIFWETRRGVIYGPFSPIYGAGAVSISYIIDIDKSNKTASIVNDTDYATGVIVNDGRCHLKLLSVEIV